MVGTIEDGDREGPAPGCGSGILRRIQDAREDVADAKEDQARTKAEAYLNHLSTLEAAI
jgi:hypothetical protein